MESTPSQQSQQTTEDKDKNCRLRHGLNDICLASIFQYLDTDDLLTVSEMNAFYYRIIKSFVITKHKVCVDKLFQQDGVIEQFFRKFGEQIGNVCSFNISRQQLFQFNQLITQYCSTDQLKDVHISTGFWDEEFEINLSPKFERVEKFIFYVCPMFNTVNLSVSFSSSLRYLELSYVDLNPNFDWSQLVNLTKLQLTNVSDIDSDNFIGLIRKRPSLESFLNKNSFDYSRVKDILDAMAIYCGDKIREFEIYDNEPENRKFYEFITKFTNLNWANLRASRICCSDLIDPIRRLAENDTITRLGVTYCGDDSEDNENCTYESCIFQKQPNHNGLDMNHFENLKEFRICIRDFEDNNELNRCKLMKFFDVYSSRLFPNVERFVIGYTAAPIYNLIKYMPKLRELTLACCEHTPHQAAEVLSIVGSILNERKTGQNNSDIIEILVTGNENVFDSFSVHDNINGSIKLTHVTF